MKAKETPDSDLARHSTAQQNLASLRSHLLTEGETTLQSSGEASGGLRRRLWASRNGRRNTVLFITSRHEVITRASGFLSHDPSHL